MAKSKEKLRFGLPVGARDAIKRILKETMPSRWKLYTLSLFCMAGVAAFTGALAYSTKLIVNDAFSDGQSSDAWKIAILVVTVSIAKSSFQYFNSIISLRFIQSISSEYKRKIFNKLIDGNVRTVADNNAADHMGRLKIMAGSASNVVVSLSNKFITDLLTLLALIGVMVVQDPVMSIMGAVLFPLIFLIVNHLTHRIRNLASNDAELEGGLFSVGAEVVEGIKTVKSYRLEAKSKARFSDTVQKIETRRLQIGKISSITMPLMEAIGGLVLGLFIIYASWQTVTNGKTPGQFTAFITAFLLAYQPAERISKLWVALQRSVIHLERMYGILDRTSDRYDEKSNKLVNVSSSIEFDHVGYNYGRGTALEDVSFSIEPGERIAIVGRSGAGKTTLVDLILDFCIPTSGSVRIGGVDTKDVANNEIWGNVALISQDVFLFDASVAENIKDGKPDITDEELEDVTRRAALADANGSVTQILATEIGPQGNKLSGGQRQRVAIARAFAKKAKIYIFDEATSALDGENERAIMAATVDNFTDSTMLFVSHRASTLEWVDRVIFLEKGKLSEIDTHAALLATNENYRSLFQIENNDPT